MKCWIRLNHDNRWVHSSDKNNRNSQKHYDDNKNQCLWILPRLWSQRHQDRETDLANQENYPDWKTTNAEQHNAQELSRWIPEVHKHSDRQILDIQVQRSHPQTFVTVSLWKGLVSKKKYPSYLDIRAAIRALAGKLQETGKPSKTGQGVSSISKILRS